ncbi:competence protein ComK [Bacillus sp. 2205SS5-2]|uniref:competence protein ComK n=1 Tax=Bacillus sp. 2205SS5-2 TaxID=3109031 RepID=UPI0030062AFE
MIENDRFIEEYEMNPQTMILLPVEYGQELYTKVFELHDEFLSPRSPLEIIRKSCEYFGSSYDGRKNGTKFLTGVVYKAPIIVDSHTSIFSFPTSSPSNPNCIWICEKHVKRHERVEPKVTKVVFKNGQSFHLPISLNSFVSQRTRTLMLTSRFMYAIEEMKKKDLNNPSHHEETAEKKTYYWIDFIKGKERV